MSDSEQPPTEKVEEDIKTLSDELSRISSTYNLYLKLANQQEVDAHVLNPAPAFFGRVFESTETEVLLSLAKLFGVRTSEPNLLSLVEYVQSNREAIDWGHEEISREQIEKHKRLLDKHTGVMEDVIALRNEFYADHDTDYLLVAEDLTAEYPLEVDEVEMLFDVAKSILEDYHRALTGRYLDDRGRMDVDRVFRALGEYYKDGDYTLATLG